MLADIRNAHDQIGRQLVLDFEAPILNHRRTAVGRIGVLRPREVQLRGVKIGRSGIGRQSRINLKRGIEAIDAVERGGGLEAGEVKAAKIRILQVAVENAVSAAENGIAFQHGRRPGKAEARTEIFLPDVGPTLAHIAISSRPCSRKDQHARQIAGAWIGSRQADVGSISTRFPLWLVDLISETDIKSQSGGRLYTVLNETRKVAAQPLRLSSIGLDVCGTEFSQQHAGNSVSTETGGNRVSSGLGTTKGKTSTGVLIIERRVLLIPLLVADFELVAPLHPGYGVIQSKAVVDRIPVNAVAKARGRGFCHIDRREHEATGSSDAEFGVPVGAPTQTYARADIGAVGAVVAQVEMVQDRWSNGVVVSETDEVSGKCLVSTISRGPCPFWCGRNAVIGPGIIGEVSFALRADVLVDTNRHRRVELRPAVTERVVIDQVAILWRGIVGKKGLAHGREPALRDSVPSISRFIHKSGSALYAANRLRGGRIVDFPLEHLQAGTGVDDRIAVGVGQTRPELRIKIAGKFIGSRNRRGRRAAIRLSVLFPRKEEERFVLSIVEVRDYDRATEGSTVVVLPVCWRLKYGGIGGILR